MKIGRLFPDLLATLGRAASPEVGFARTLRRLVDDSGAVAGGLLFTPLGGRRIQVTVGSRPGSALEAWIGERLAEPALGRRASRNSPVWSSGLTTMSKRRSSPRSRSRRPTPSAENRMRRATARATAW